MTCAKPLLFVYACEVPNVAHLEVSHVSYLGRSPGPRPLLLPFELSQRFPRLPPHLATPTSSRVTFRTTHYSAHNRNRFEEHRSTAPDLIIRVRLCVLASRPALSTTRTRARRNRHDVRRDSCQGKETGKQERLQAREEEGTALCKSSMHS